MPGDDAAVQGDDDGDDDNAMMVLVMGMAMLFW